jgi:hypothetical protein
LILEVDRQWFPELFPEEETHPCLPILLHLHLVVPMVVPIPHPAILRQWRIPFHLHLAVLLPVVILWRLHLTLPLLHPLKPILLPRHLADLLPEEGTPQCQLILLLLHPVALHLCLFQEVSHLYQPILSGLP